MAHHNLTWEDIPHSNGFYLRRTPIFGGWLVQMIADVISPDHTKNSEWRTSVTFVPDPNWLWDLSKQYNSKNNHNGN